MRILIIEDEQDLVSGIRRGLEKNDYEVDVAMDGEEGLGLIEENDYDCVLLDLNLPKLDGLSLLKKVREKDLNTRFLILSARSDVEDKVQGLNLGADDYLAKPFYFIELLARIRNLTRRQYLSQGDVITIENMVIDTLAKTVRVQGQDLHCTAREYRILEYLAMHRGQYCSAESIIEYVWQSEADFFSNSLKVHMSSLRKKMQLAEMVTAIESKKGIGYRLGAGR